MSLPGVIAIDGPVASGKTTVGRTLAKRLGYRFVDTGLMYRAITCLALRRGIALDDERALGALSEQVRLDVLQAADGSEHVLADGEDLAEQLRTGAVEEAVSVVSQVSRVRRAMVAQQQRMGREGRVVMVGRDIGTKVLPQATKVYLDASPAERVRRRHGELAEVGMGTTLEAVGKNLELRDRLDSQREEGPLRAAEDAVRVDTDGLDVGRVVESVLALIGAERASGQGE